MKGIAIRFHSDAHVIAPKVADAEVWFITGRLAGLKLVGFALWRQPDGGLRVTLPARTFSVNGERRSFSMLRLQSADTSIEPFTNYILDAWRAHERAATETAGGNS